MSVMKAGEEISEGWLEGINARFNQEDVPPRRRAWQALVEWSKTNGPIDFPSERATKVCDWFTNNSKHGSQDIGSMFNGSFYFEGCFWPVWIPILYGFNFELHPLNYLEAMSDQIKARLMSNREKKVQYAELFADCLDYAYGYDDLTRVHQLSEFCLELLKSGDKELRATVILLHEHRPNAKAIESARMATEMFLKSFLAARAGLTETEAKKQLGHNLQSTIDRCLKIQDYPDLQRIPSKLNCFPKIDERYKGSERGGAELWVGYQVAQFIGATVTRLLSGQDTRSTIEYGGSKA